MLSNKAAIPKGIKTKTMTRKTIASRAFWALTAALAPAATAVATGSDGQGKAGGYIFQSTANPYLPLWEHTPDGEPRVFEDPDNPGKYRIYVVFSHDTQGSKYCGADIRMWSAPTDDLSQWRDEGPIFTYRHGGKWDEMYAPDLVMVKKKDGKKVYYLYPNCRGAGRETMVAASERPDGLFKPVNLDANGQKALDGGTMGFDPAVYVEQIDDPADPDFAIGFRAYGYWGFRHSSAAQLDQTTMSSVRKGTELMPYFIPASDQYGKPREGKVAKDFPCIFKGQNLGDFNFYEASSIRKIGNKYVFIYSGFSGPDYGLASSNSTLRYAYGDTPLGPWKSGGVLVDSRAPELSIDGSKMAVTNGGHNTHGSIEQINGQWYVFYHRTPRDYGYARQAMVAPVTVKFDEQTVANGGKVAITGYTPYGPDHSKTVKDPQGNEYKGAEVTSEGFHLYGLDPYRFYSAGIACYLSNVDLQQDSWDVWGNSAALEGFKNGDVAGYKYFGFAGLANDTLGLKAFQGADKGSHTKLNLYLRPTTAEAFKVNVWMDAPSASPKWKGTKIATISVKPGKRNGQTVCYQADVASAVEGLHTKRAIYLVAEGPKETKLFDLAGLGFSSDSKRISMPQTPKVDIYIDGEKIETPQTPEWMTAENGHTSFGTYKIIYGKTKLNNKIHVIKAASNNKEVAITIDQPQRPGGKAVVKCEYKGATKTYEIVFKN